MSIFSEANADALTVPEDSAASGPLVGFFENFQIAAELQKRTSSQFGIEYYMSDLDEQQRVAMANAGVKNAPRLSMLMQDRAYISAARLSAGEQVDPANAKALQDYDAQIATIQQQHPDLKLKTSGQMFDEVKAAAQDIERRNAGMRTTTGGAVGGFIGGALASLNPRTDPLNFVTLPVGGAGKSVLARIASQAVGQGGIEAVNQITGVQEERRLLGLSYGAGDALSRVGMAAAGGAAVQGVGEVVGAGLKRWFRAAPNDPVPARTVAETARAEPPKLTPANVKTEARVAQLEQNTGSYVNVLAERSPIADTRLGLSRSVADIEDVTRQLDAWDSGPVAALRPRTQDAAYLVPTEVKANVDTSAALKSNATYQAAKAVDPAAFNRFEKLTQRKAAYTRWIEELTQGRNNEVQATLDKMDTHLRVLDARLRETQGKTNKLRIREEAQTIRADRESLLKSAEVKETPDVREVRRALMKTDEQMRDLAPAIGRAYSRAGGEWDHGAAGMDTAYAAYKAGKPDLQAHTPEWLDAAKAKPIDVPDTLEDRAPILKRADVSTTKATSAETASEIVKADIKAYDEALTAFRASLNNLLSETGDGKVRIGDHEFDVNDTIHVEDADGVGREISVREMLTQNREAEDELGALTSCSIR